MTDAEKAYSVAEEMIAEALADGNNELIFDHKNTSALEGLPPQITKLTNLQTLDCTATQVHNLSRLSGLSNLRRLILPGESGWRQHLSAVDISPLASLRNLTELSMGGSSVTNFSAIAGLSNLVFLSLNRTSISDLSPLSGLVNLKRLELHNTQVRDLRPLENLSKLRVLVLSSSNVVDLSSLSSLTSIARLYLGNTFVFDVSPLTSLKELEVLSLFQTRVFDLSPLTSLRKLKALNLSSTKVSELRPLLGMSLLVDSPVEGGLRFSRTSIAGFDTEVAAISAIENDSKRAEKLFSYLEREETPTTVQNVPEPDSLFHIFSDSARLEVSLSLPLEAEREERLKKVLHEQLQDRSKALAQQAGNQFFRLAARARGLVDQVDKDFAELDLLMLHLAIEDLRAMEVLGREDEESGAFPPEVLVALSDVLRLGPGLTLGHADVDLLVERANARRAAPPVPEAETQAQDAMSDVLANALNAIGDNLIALSKDVYGKDDAEHRETQKAANWNVLWVLAASAAAGVGAVVSGVTTNVLTPPVTEFVTANWPTLLSVVQTNGVAFVEWFLVSMGNVSEFAGLVASSPDRRAIEARRKE